MIAPGPLLEISGTGDPVSVAQENFELLTREIFAATPTFESGVATTLIGPPTSGAHLLDEFWKDAWLAKWRCTVAGTPGTWRQETPAIRAGEPVAGTIPTGYFIQDSSSNFAPKYHAGAYVWIRIDSILPNYTKTVRNALTPAAGWAVYQTDNTPGLRVYNGSNWMRFTETSDP